MPSEPWRLTELTASLDAYAAAAEVLAAPSPSMLQLGLKHVEASGDFDDWRARGNALRPAPGQCTDRRTLSSVDL
ncbi:hypothetical protein ALMP_38920 [Streptomyces sp. A012304]|nr:hypothetical protein ALMP_38920 [Streptomyces sp. A012304]